MVNNNACTITDGSGAAVTDADGDGAFWCFELVGVAIANGVQSGDDTCTRWTIDHRGVQTAFAADGVTDNTDRCWRS